MSAWQSLVRTLGLARVNWLLMVRNRTTMLYAFVLPLLPLALIFVAADGVRPPPAGSVTVTLALVMALLFPGYYNLLSMFVSRRDELVLKRLRTGEVRDGELIVSMALPGVWITFAIALMAVPLTVFAGYSLRLNVPLLLAGLLLACVTFAALALWTAGWTRTAESAQLTSAPVMLIAFGGFLSPVLPGRWQGWVEWLPGAALERLVRVGWFGQTSYTSAPRSMGHVEGWFAAMPGVAALMCWAVVAGVLAAMSLRWEPRS